MDNLVYNAVAPWKGYLHWLGNIREGETKSGAEYAFADFTLRYTDHKMQEKYITFTASSVSTVDTLKRTPLDTPLRVYWTPEAKEDTQRDRWYPSYNAYSVSVIREDASPRQQQHRQAPANQQAEPQRSRSNYTPSNDDLPF